jgi:uncharacterized protein (DUF1778 family)
MQENKNKIKVIVTEDVSSGVYANNVIINFNNTEFMLDFALFQPQNSTNKVQTRVIMHPNGIRALMNSLDKTLKMYETAKNNAVNSNNNSSTIQ